MKQKMTATDDDGWYAFGTIYQHRNLSFKVMLASLTMSDEGDLLICETLAAKERFAITPDELDADYIKVWEPSTRCVVCDGKASLRKVSSDSFLFLCKKCYKETDFMAINAKKCKKWRTEMGFDQEISSDARFYLDRKRKG